MHRHRLAWTGALLCLAAVGCAKSPHEDVSAGAPITTVTDAGATSSPAAEAVTQPPAQTATEVEPATAAAVVAAPGPAPARASVTRVADTPPVADAAVPVAAPAPPATFTVTYTAHDGGTATATLVETGAEQSLATGAAVFAGLADGSYTVQIQVVYPVEESGGTGIAAQTVVRANRVVLHAGDQAVVSCDDNGCTGIS